jgi:hypothetical protein
MGGPFAGRAVAEEVARLGRSSAASVDETARPRLTPNTIDREQPVADVQIVSIARFIGEFGS